MKTQFGEKNNIASEFIKIMGERIYDADLDFEKEGNVKFLIRFYRLHRGEKKPISFYNAFFTRTDEKMFFEIVKVNSIKLDGKYYHCGFRALPEADTYKYITDQLLIDYGWVENNKKILYMDLEFFVILYDELRKYRRKRNNLTKRILLEIIAMT